MKLRHHEHRKYLELISFKLNLRLPHKSAQSLSLGDSATSPRSWVMVSTRITALVRMESFVEPFWAFKADNRSSSGEQEEQSILFPRVYTLCKSVLYEFIYSIYFYVHLLYAAIHLGGRRSLVHLSVILLGENVFL